MQLNLNNEINHRLTVAVQHGDWDVFSSLRAREGDPGYLYVIDNLNLSSRDLSEMPVNFVCFKNSNLTGSSLANSYFHPTALWRCNVQNIDLRGSGGMLFAYNCDLRGVLFDADTFLGASETHDIPSAFKDCLMDDSFKEFLVRQGVLFDFPLEMNIEQYAFGMTLD